MRHADPSVSDTGDTARRPDINRHTFSSYPSLIPPQQSLSSSSSSSSSSSLPSQAIYVLVDDGRASPDPSLRRPPPPILHARLRASSHFGLPRTDSTGADLSLPPSPPPGSHKRQGASNSLSHVNAAFRGSSSSLGLGAAPYWTPLSSILHSLPQSPSMFATNNAQTQPQAQIGEALPDITTDALGFVAIAGETKLRFLPEPWPADSLPQSTSSLLSIASRNELVAAAGPSKLVLASTATVRAAFASGGVAVGGSDEHNFKPFTPELTIDTPLISHVAFSSDESSLVISAKENGGLAIYDVQSLKRGSTESAFQLATNGVAVRALIPNPAPEFAHRFAVVLAGGQLVIADLKERSLSQGPNGPVLSEGVSCVSWSARGKQLVAGLGDGSAAQMQPDGTIQAHIPRCPEVPADQHVSGISWLDNDHFLIIYTPSNFEGTPESIFVYVSRAPKTSNFTYQKLPDPVGTFGLSRCPPHHFVCRLRKFPPSLSDTLILASSASTDVGLFTCSEKPLAHDAPNTAEKYTCTRIGDDTRMAQLPTYTNSMGELTDTSPIGLALDLSSKDTVKRPIPSDEMGSSSTPLPNLMLLNNEGVLSSWWFVYSDSVKNGTAFPGLVAASSDQQQTQAPAPATSGFGTPSQPRPAFGSSAATGSGAFGQPAFGTPSAPIATAGSGFGASTPIGGNNSPWGAPSSGNAFSASGSAPSRPAFGSSTQIGAGGGFGAVGGLGNRASPWGAQEQNQQSSETKPSNPFSSTSAISPFASVGQQSSNNTSSKTPASPFSNTSGTSGFASLGHQSESKSIFGSASTSNAPGLTAQPSFGSTVTIGSNFSNGSFGGPSSLGEPKSAWATPSLSNNTSSGSANRGLFGNASSGEADMTIGDGDNDMETESQSQEESKGPADGNFGLFPKSTSGFKLGSSFKPDADASKNEDSKPSGPSMFGDSFGKVLGETQKTAGRSILDSPNPVQSQEQEAASSKNKDSEASAQSGLFSTSKPVSSEPPRPLFGQIASNQGTEAKNQPPISKLATSVSQPDETQKAPLSSKANSESSWETVQRSPTELGAEQEPAPLPPSPPALNQKDLEEPPLPPTPGTTGSNQEKEKQADETPLPTTENPIRNDTVERSSSAKADDSEPPLPPSPSSVQPVPQQQVEQAPSISLPSSTTPARQQQPPSFFSTPQTAFGPRSPSPLKQNQTRGTFSTTPTAPPPVKPIPASRSSVSFQRPSRLASSEEAPSVPEPSKVGAQKEGQAPEEYIDDSDVRIREELDSQIEPTKQLAPFIAHQDYVGKVPGQGLPAQIERVYRDIQSMIDTLGLNARSLKAFVTGHEHQYKDGGRVRDDLDEDDWCLIEIADLAAVEDTVSQRLEQNRLPSVDVEVADMQDMQRALAKLRARHNGLQQLIRSFQNVEDGDDTRDFALDGPRNPLTTEQSVVLQDLRGAFAEFQKLLALAEDALTVLRAKVVSAQPDRDQFGAPRKVPTFEAVSNTISKMTRMIEQKSGDLDVLEAQMRKLRLRTNRTSVDMSGSLDEVLGRMTLGSSVLGDSRRFRTPPGSRGGVSAQNHSSPNNQRASTYQLSYESNSDDEYYDTQTKGSPVARKNRKGAGPQVSPVQIEAYTAMAARRAKVLGLFKKKVCERGTLTQGL